jgi:hypothetical protein
MTEVDKGTYCFCIDLAMNVEALCRNTAIFRVSESPKIRLFGRLRGKGIDTHRHTKSIRFKERSSLNAEIHSRWRCVLVTDKSR